jgi:pyocin large subunit-like protein
MFLRFFWRLVLFAVLVAAFVVANHWPDNWRVDARNDAPPELGQRFNWGNAATLDDHFARHGADFGAKSAMEYARLAMLFGERAQRGELPVKVDDDGTRRVFDIRSRTFGAYNDDWTTKTFFKPDRLDYFARQPGRIISPR